MLDIKDAWFYYHDKTREQIDLAEVMKTVESVCSTLGLKLGQKWESYDEVAQVALDQSISHLFETRKL